MQELLEQIRRDVLATTAPGEVASYIPELAKADSGKFGIALVLADGTEHVAGDADEAFSIQSVSKVFTLALALGRYGESLWTWVGREPSGSRFDSIIQLEHEKGRPRNPFINAGAIVVTDRLLSGHTPRECLGEILRFLRGAAGSEDIRINPAVARSEQATGFRNFALANYLRSHGNLLHPVELVLGVYFHQCAIEMSCRELALAGRFLAFGGRIGPGGPRIVGAERARRINAIMMTCGHYDASGDFAFRVGLPGKSGVGGGILVVVPGRASIAAWSPGLTASGSSLRGGRALELLAARTGWSVFGPPA
ncbi:MAG TPA: glutaminase [Paracoccaceae bacterium]|nr:glutaminase [Paracoccaceae bacterium]